MVSTVLSTLGSTPTFCVGVIMDGWIRWKVPAAMM